MKKTVFLLLIFSVFLSFRSTHAVGYNPEVHQMDGYQFILQRYLVGEYNRYEITKTGDNPFNLNVQYDDVELKISGITEFEDFFILYGYAHIEYEPTFYDGLILMIDRDGQLIRTEYIDYDLLEEIIGVFDIDNQIYVAAKQSHGDEWDRYVFDKVIYSVYDYQFNLIDEVYSDVDPDHLYASSEMIIISTNRDEYAEHGLTKNLEFMEDVDELLIEPNSTHYDSVYIGFLNQAILNGEIIENGIVIDYPGLYSITYNGNVYHFSVLSTVSGVEDGEVYNEPVIPIVSAGNVYLNDDLFSSGEEVSEPGNYTLKVVGMNGLEQTYDFVITSGVEGILDNQVYTKPVDITFNGNGYLNNVYIDSPFSVDEPGEYILKIQGNNNYLETYYFNIEEEKEETSLISFIQKYDVVFLAIVSISGLIILKKK